jgi:hypothetical protein
MNIYLKLFLAAGIPFGIFMGIFYILVDGLIIGLIKGLIAGILFGGLMSLILGLLHTSSVKRMPYGKSKEAMKVHQVRNIELQLPYDKVFNLCVDSLGLIKECEIQEKDHLQGKIVAKSGTTWKSWGEIITFQLHKIDNKTTQVIVSSRPVVSTTIVDYGKNLENVERITSFLKEQNKTFSK